MPGEGDTLVAVGEVVGLHGLRGDLKVRPLTPGSESLLAATRVTLRRSGRDELQGEPLRTARHKGNVLLRLRGIETPEAAEPLVGSTVCMLRREFGELEEGEYYWDQLEGLEVIDRRLGALGKLVDIFPTAAYDVYVVRGPRGETLIPAVAAMILAIDPDAGQIQVDLPDGLAEAAE